MNTLGLGRRWISDAPDSIKELNQPAVMFFSQKFHSGIEPQFYSQNSLFWLKMTSLDTPLPNIHLPLLFHFFFVLFQERNTMLLSGIGLWANNILDSILEWNQSTWSKWFLGYHQGIEPGCGARFFQFLPSRNWTTILWGKTPLLTVLDTPLPNILHPQPWSWFFLLSYAVFSRPMFSKRETDLKREHNTTFLTS